MTNQSPQSGMDPQVGDVIADKYRLESLLGQGGMGSVFSASHLELDRTVAVKFVHAGISDNPEISARFLREAKAVVKIQSEHVAQVIDVGYLDDGTPFMVMEYLDGNDLSEVAMQGRLAIEDAVDYVIQACSAMVEAHHLGIIHRDLKPANLFLAHRRDGTPIVKVLDFGISKWNEPDRSQAALTNPSVLMGSPAYMSPEQLRSARDVDHRSDIWSLGVILFELIAGQPAFDAESLPLLMTTIMRDEPASLLSLRPEVSQELADVVAKCLAKDPAARFQSVAEMANALLYFAPERSRYNIERITKASGLPPPSRLSTTPVPVVPPLGEFRTSGLGPSSSNAVPGENVTNGTWVGDQSKAGPPRGMPFGMVAALVGGLVVVGGGSIIWLTRAPEPDAGAEIPSAATGGQPVSSVQPAASQVPVEGRPSPSTSVPPVPAPPEPPLPTASPALPSTSASSAQVPSPPPATVPPAPARPPSPPLQQRTPAAPRDRTPPPRPRTPSSNPLDMELK